MPARPPRPARRQHPTRHSGLRTTGTVAAAALALGAGLFGPLKAPAAKAAEPPAEDHCQAQCADILPPGQNGNATLAEILAHRVLGTRPAHSSDQIEKYDALVAGSGALTDEKLTDFFNDASFGVPDGQQASVDKPRADVTITRDKRTGVPRIKGTSRHRTLAWLVALHEEAEGLLRRTA
ncbi:hypothetical protein GCM10010329_70580 [Streptomyces spiroverticillatus]|uniref:Uncharacterized protein n=1 Tax=Streptomyces finlayi TaxID=67296 RepID=A0A918X0Y3_9ACTN|nr:hypothetical protein GCM10010329_70580 [Streptomyces spiroverticillatus]GHD01492.1 hypothetical protein GCM10010334_47220 [Streptomyces finlayi]